MRHWLRSGLPGARVERLRKGSAFLVRVAAVVIYAEIGKAIGSMSLTSAAAGVPSVEWLVLSVLGFTTCWGMLIRSRNLRGMAPPLASPFLDTLPVYDGARTLVESLEVALAHIVTAAAFVAAAPSLPHGESIALGLAASISASTLGAALMRWAFVLVPSERAMSVAQAATFVQALFLMAGFIGPMTATLGKRVHPFFLAPLARPLAGDGGLAAAFAFTGGLFVFGVVALMLAERVGYDQAEVVPRKKFTRAETHELTVGPIDELLARREPGGRRWPFLLFGAMPLVGMAALFMTGSVLDSAFVHFLPHFFVGWTGYMALVSVAGLASRAVSRDLVARPFLAALPIEPRDLIDGKVAVVRRRIFLGLFPLALALLTPMPSRIIGEIAWRGGIVALAAWIYGSAAVSVAFLTGGVQNNRVQPGGTLRLESLLLLTPLMAILFADKPWQAIVPMIALALVALEARRAATRVVRWLDDGEDFERETPAWRAALAFAAFQASQVLAARFLVSFTHDGGFIAAGSYGASAIVLAVLVAYGRRELAPLRFWPKNPLAVVLGLAGGTATAFFARFLVGHVLHPDPTATMQHASHAGQIAFALTAGVAAPLAEELFFRGWLQHAVAHELDARGKWIAPVIAALAFASVHPAISFLAVFPVGLIAGALYAATSSLAPCLAVHATHNWLVVLGSIRI